MKNKEENSLQEYDNPEQLLAFADHDFLSRSELMHVRLLLEYLRPDIVLDDHNIKKAIVFFGSARIPYENDALKNLRDIEGQLQKKPNDLKLQHQHKIASNHYKYSKYLDEATRLAELVATSPDDYTVFTGGGPSFMEAANKGAYNKGKPSVSLNITLPNEELPNQYCSKDLTFQFKYFAIRKIHLLNRARAVIAFPGGFGTLDEIFEAFTLQQNGRLRQMPFILFSHVFWSKAINFEALIDAGTISKQDIDCIHYVETASEAMQIIDNFYK